LQILYHRARQLELGQRSEEHMERACFTFTLRPGMEDEYKRRHDEIWPDLVEDIREAGVRNYSLFRRGSTVFAYCECDPDVATSFARLGESTANARWSKWFQDVIESLTDDNGQLRFAQEVWHLD
jgi:L-rhamnose mutarotase